MSRRKILLKRNNQVLSDGKPKLPTPDQIDNGELVMNYATGVETLAIKNSNDEIVTFTNEVKIGNETPANGSMAKLFINENDSSLQYHTNEGWQPIDIGGGGEPVDIVQTTGTSTTSVMSQNAVTTELNKKANTSHTHTTSQINGLSTVATTGSYNDLLNKPTIPSDDVATTEANGLMSAKDKEKLDNIHENATQVAFTQTMSSGTAIGTININGKATTLYAPTAGEPVEYGNATASAVGLVKLGSDTIQNVAANTITSTASRTYAVQNNNNGQMVVNVPWTDTNTTYNIATSSADGLMSSKDKEKLDGIASGATKVTIDSALSSSSTNPVQNKVINSALSGKANTSHTHTASQVSGLASVATSGSYNDLTNKPTIPSAYVLPTASTTTLGGVRVGDGLEIDGSGILNCTIDPGSGTVSWGNIQGKPAFATVATSGSYNDLSDKPDIPSPYTLPTASAAILGGIKVGDNLSIEADGTLNGIPTSWTNITGKPSTFTPSAHTHTANQVTDLATVATTGSYDDLQDKPTIPPAYTLPTASSSTLGGVKSSTTGTTPDRDYMIQVNPDGTMKVNVPWVEDTTYTNGEGLNLSGSEFSLKTADMDNLGGVKLGRGDTIGATAALNTSTPNRVYAVGVNSRGRLVVDVPWINTTYSNATTTTAGLMGSTDKQNLTNIVGKSVVVSLGDLEVTYDDTSASIKQTGTTLSLGGTETLETPTFVLGVIAAATTSKAGLMTAADKTKLNTLETNPQGTVDNPYIIQEGDDINDCVSLGWYISNSSEGILNHPPTIGSFSMLVIPSSVGPNQIAFTDEGKICVRDNGDVWYELYTEPITDEEITELLLT